MVPEGDYHVELGKAEVTRVGTDVTLVGYGAQMNVLEAAAVEAAKEGISVEVVDLRTILPWDRETVVRSATVAM
jgi:2-oxoisovalerate dehydrogenase E1 component beta subunit